MKKIATIAVRSVRGVRRELTLRLNGSSLILRGDNGTGKSSIVAGLMWALTGELEPSGRAKAGTEEAYRSNILEKASASRVVDDMTMRFRPAGAVEQSSTIFPE
jgi:ABC-type transport system involved in cytochrome c biogenesis ATPase subunit